MDMFESFTDPNTVDAKKVNNDDLVRHRILAHRHGHVCYCEGSLVIESCSLDAILAQRPPSHEPRDECTICIDEYGTDADVLTQLNCNHVFHRGCIGTWLQEKGSCPNCRGEQQREYDQCMICRAYGLDPEDKGSDAALSCCNFRVHVGCWNRVYNKIEKRCPGCQAKNPKYQKFYTLDPSDLELAEEGEALLNEYQIN